MSVASNVAVKINMTGDIEFGDEFNAAQNSSAPGVVGMQDLASGANTITVPTGATGVTIIPPAGNTETITAKGVTGDTGISLHRTNPSYIGLYSVSTFVLTASGTVTALRLIWS
jgi:hypothetical protein